MRIKDKCVFYKRVLGLAFYDIQQGGSKMDVKEIAKKLVPLLGGKENIASAQHCATRLRLVIRDESKIDQKGLDEIEDVKGLFQIQDSFKSFLEPVSLIKSTLLLLKN